MAEISVFVYSSEVNRKVRNPDDRKFVGKVRSEYELNNLFKEVWRNNLEKDASHIFFDYEDAKGKAMSFEEAVAKLKGITKHLYIQEFDKDEDNTYP